MGTLSDLRGLTTETVRVGALDVPIRGLSLEEWAALEARFPDMEGVLSGKAKPGPATLAAIVTPGLAVNGEAIEEAEVRALPAGTLMLLGNAILLATFPQVKAPLEAALQKAGLQRAATSAAAAAAAAGAATSAPVKPSRNSSKR